MSAGDNQPGEMGELCKRAQEKAREKNVQCPENIDSMSAEEIQRMFHDLRVHQIELEMQNEELRIAQENLTLSRDRFSVLFHQAPIGYLVLDQNGIIQEASDMFRRMTHTDSNKIRAKGLYEFIEGSDREWFLSRYRSFFNHPEGKNLEVRLISGSHQALFVRITGAKLSTVESHPFPEHASQLLVAVSDTTDQKRAEIATKAALSEALHREHETQALLAASRAVMECSTFEESSRRIFDTCRDVTGAVSGYVALLNQNGTENDVLFLEAGNLPCTVDPCLPMPIRGLRADAYTSARVVYENDFMNSEWVHFMPQGHVEMQNVMFAPLIIDEKVVGVMGLANKSTDFTEEDAGIAGALGGMAALSLRRVRAEETLRERERYLSAILETTQDGFWVLDPEGRIIEVNQAYCRMSGYTQNELLHMHIRDLNAAETPDETVERIKRVIRNGSELFETRHRRKDGSVFDVEVSAMWMETGTGRFVCFFRDITERKRAEEQLRWLHKAESLRLMAGAIAHNFNNQLQVVIGNLEMAMMDDPSQDSDSLTMAEALKAARKAARLSGMMLTYLGQASGKHEPLDLSETCRQSLLMLQAEKPKEIVLDAHLPSPGPIVKANAHQIRQVLTNLTTNAWEAIDEGPGNIHLTVKMVVQTDISATHHFPPDWQPLNIPYACLEVTDTGYGIQDRDIEKIFDPFFTTKFTGRGLGLPIVMGIIGAHGGGCTVESEMGRGSVFRVFLPASFEDVPLLQERTAIERKFEGGGTVLLVEDETQVRNMVRTMLSRLGYGVIEAKDGVEAVEIFQQYQDKIRCVLSDLTMPHMNGWDTLAALREISPEIPVILSSGYDEAQVMTGEHCERPDAFIGKPYQLKGLRDTIHRVLLNKLEQIQVPNE
ncbi:MAG: PAS domain S-box protein [Pseudomonadota bacterium]